MSLSRSDPWALGSDPYRFTPEESWPRLPAGFELGDTAGIAVDRRDWVYLFNRGPHPVVVVDADGDFQQSWGEGAFVNPHGAALHPDGESLWLTDNGDHTVRRYTLDGEPLLEIGVPGSPVEPMSGGPFCCCTHTAVGPDGRLYVSDGYGNARVHVYALDGGTARLIGGWGEPGAREGQFNLPHNLAVDPRDGRVLVADRENHRVQVFDADGRFLSAVNGIHRPSGLAAHLGEDGRLRLVVGELAPRGAIKYEVPNLGPRVTVLAEDGTVLSEISAGVLAAPGQAPGQFLSPHALAFDSAGDLYVGEVGHADWPTLFPGVPEPARLRGVQKLRRLRAG
ncbi:peptidyl-alpha-hydroxyglycine alpha-amidating lyase family protein [Phaeacidiphilus oryzae]|uniref:peptidyl-alpha-hydroxyglycine alpha-amidating lyase family protein n=1 Tax=Phaeacidiphilus oryzae TaxID=348818 RepID=UPI000A5627F0|nr:peptidyl-alpha-hydroxyglycine alpha-amidating lyase family protein [Phaeacidiphilus oryzae]